LLANPEVADFRKLLLEQLGTLDPAADGFPKSCVKFAESISKDTAQRRERLYLLNDIAIEFYHQLYRRASGQEVAGDATMKQHVELAINAWTAGLSPIGKSIDRLCDFQKQIEGYANFNNACDLLFRDLARLSAGQQPVTVG
jgi:hypothetical protein